MLQLYPSRSTTLIGLALAANVIYKHAVGDQGGGGDSDTDAFSVSITGALKSQACKESTSDGGGRQQRLLATAFLTTQVLMNADGELRTPVVSSDAVVPGTFGIRVLYIQHLDRLSHKEKNRDFHFVSPLHPLILLWGMGTDDSITRLAIALSCGWLCRIGLSRPSSTRVPFMLIVLPYYLRHYMIST